MDINLKKTKILEEYRYDFKVLKAIKMEKI